MKIEISEVFVTRTDAMTLEHIPAPVGIAALEPRINIMPANTKTKTSFPARWLRQKLQRFLTVS